MTKQHKIVGLELWSPCCVCQCYNCCIVYRLLPG